MALVSEVLSWVPGAGVADGSTDEANHGRVPPARPQHCSGHYSMCASLDTAYLQRLTGTLNNIYRDGGWWCCCGWWWWCGLVALWRLFDIKTVGGNESQNPWIIMCDILHQAVEVHLAPAPPPLYEYQAMQQNKSSAASKPSLYLVPK